MASLGQQATDGGTFTVTSTFGDIAGGGYGVPSPGIFVNDIKAVCGNNGTSSTDRLYVWKDNGSGIPGVWLVRSGTFSTGGLGTHTRSDININTGQLSSDGYIPAGTVIFIGAYFSSGTEQFQGHTSGLTELGNTSDGNWSDHGPAVGIGQMAAWIDYSPLPAPSLTSVSPSTAAAGQTVTLSGSHLLHTTGITVCGVTASTYTINSDTSITLTIPSGAAGTGTIVVTTPAGSDSLAFTAGSLYADSGTAFAGGVLVYADDGTNWDQATVWADDGTTWHQIG